MRPFQTILLILSLGPILVAAKKDIEWKTGKVLDSHSARTYVDSSTSTNTTSTGAGTSTSQTKINTMAIEETQLLVAGDEYAYLISDPVAKSVGLPTHGIVTRSIMNRGHGCRFVVGENVKYFQEKSSLRIIDSDGKECKLDILRQERLK